MSARLLGPASGVRCERERAYAHLLGKARAKLSYARMRLARAECFEGLVAGGCGPGWAAVIAHWLAEVRRWERVAKYLARRHRLAVAFGV